MTRYLVRTGIVLVLVLAAAACSRQPPLTPEPAETTATAGEQATPVDEDDSTSEATATPLSTPPSTVLSPSPAPSPASSTPESGESTQPPTATTVATGIDAEANRDGVETIRGGQREGLPAPGETVLGTGDGIDVDANGRAILRFEDLLSVEVLRDGELVLQELAADEQSAFVTVLQRGGTLINDFNPGDEIERRFTVQTEFATITATGTRFAVVREAGSPLEWVVGLEAGEEDLHVTADGVTKQVPTGLARWVAPIGEPSAGIDADMGNVEAWINTVQAGNAQPEIGEVVWSHADVLADTENVFPLPPAGETFQVDGVGLSLVPGGNYAEADCNADGIQDLVIEDGGLTFDFRTVLARVRALDVTVVNRADPNSATVGVFDPARAEMNREAVTVGPNQCQVVSLRSDRPYHYADLRAQNACFLGFSLTPPQDDGSPGAPRTAAVCEAAPQDTQPTMTPAVTETTAYSARITNVYVDGDRYVVDFETTGFTPQEPGQHVHFFFDTVPSEQAGVPGSGPWYVYGGGSPFTGYTLAERPEGATQMCILVANPDHSVQPGSGNCVNLP